MTPSAFLNDALRRVRHPLAALRETFLSPAHPFELASMRIITYGYTAYHWWGGQGYSFDTRRNAFRAVGVYRLLGLVPDAVLDQMRLVGHWAALFCCIGFGFRFAAPVCALTMPYLLGIGNNFGKVNHPENLLAVVLVMLAFSRAGDYLSVDGWLGRRKGKRLEPSGEYRWPIAFAWLLIAGMYWSAGVSKLLHSGWSWALSDNFQRLLLRHHITHNPPTPIGIWIAQVPWFCKLMALGALVGELLCPLLLLGGGWALLFGSSLIGLQFGIYVVLGVAFHSMIPVFATLVPWAWLAERTGVLKKLGGVAPPHPHGDSPAAERSGSSVPQ